VEPINHGVASGAGSGVCAWKVDAVGARSGHYLAVMGEVLDQARGLGRGSYSDQDQEKAHT